MAEIITGANDVLWSGLLIFLLCGTGIYFTFRLRFIQIRKFAEAWKMLFRPPKSDRRSGEMTPVQALATAVAAQVGTGNLAGAATAIVSGGPGAIFWMWVSAFFGMATIYAEATLAQKFRIEVNGEVTGGPAYYIRAAFSGKFGRALSLIFAACCCLALGCMGNMVQANSIGSAFSSVLSTIGVSVPALSVGGLSISVPALIVGAIVAAAAGFVFFGGTQRLAKTVVRVVPAMAAVYILGGLLFIAMNATEIPAAFRLIFVGAFDPQALAGGALGVTVREAIRYGVACGLFSNEAGMGSTPHAHARAAVRDPHRQGLIALLSVFIDTFLILNLTVLVVLTSGVLDFSGNAGAGMLAAAPSGIALTQAAFASCFGAFGGIFVAFCLLFFAFSTILGWHFFGEVNFKYLFRGHGAKLYSLAVIAFILTGTTLKVDLVWQLADFFNGLMVLPNLLALIVLAKAVSAISRRSTAGMPPLPPENS